MPREAYEPPLTPEQAALVTACFDSAKRQAKRWSERHGLDVDDCEQHAERALMRAARGYDATLGFAFLTYLRSTMDFEVRNWRFILARQKRNRTLTDSLGFDPADHRRNECEQVDIADEAKRALRSLDGLPERERTAILMRADDRTYAEIGERIGCTKEWASQIVEKARAKLEEMGCKP